MKRAVIFFSIFFISVGCYQTSAQKEDSMARVTDSVNAQKLQDYSVRIVEIEKQRVQDSIKKAELEARLRLLSTADNLKKEELEKQIQELNQKEANRIAQKKAQIDSLRSTAKAYPVLGFFNDTLFLIFSRQGSFSARERAEAIQNRISKLADHIRFHPDSLAVEVAETTRDIIYGENIIMSVSENDALWNNTTPQELAERYRQVIGKEVSRYKSETSLVTLAKEIGLAVLVIVLFFIILYYISKLFRWSARKIIEQRDKRIKGIRIKNYTLFDARQQIKVLLGVNVVIKWFFFLLAIYLTLPILFGIFPWTEDFANDLFSYFLSPVKKIALGLWNYLPNLITIIVIVIVFRYVLKGLHFLKSEIETGRLHIPEFYPDWANPTYQIVRVLVFAFMIVVIFPYLPGSDSPVFRGVSVFLGFLFTFGSAGSLSHIIAGLVLTYMRLFKLGDRVKVGEVEGDVIEKSLLVTRVRTIKNEIISIPNSTVMNSHTINYSSDASERGLIIHTTVTIGYDVPWRKMHDALVEAALKTNMILKDPAPFVLQTGLEDFYVSYQLNAYTQEANKQALIYSLLHQNIQDVCNEQGIEIMSPHYRAARDGNTTTIPEEYLPKDYMAPAFRFRSENADDKKGKTS